MTERPRYVCPGCLDLAKATKRQVGRLKRSISKLRAGVKAAEEEVERQRKLIRKLQGMAAATTGGGVN